MVSKLNLKKSSSKIKQTGYSLYISVMLCGVRVGLQISCLGSRSQSIKSEHFFFSFILILNIAKCLNFKITRDCF